MSEKEILELLNKIKDFLPKDIHYLFAVGDPASGIVGVHVKCECTPCLIMGINLVALKNGQMYHTCELALEQFELPPNSVPN